MSGHRAKYGAQYRVRYRSLTRALASQATVATRSLSLFGLGQRGPNLVRSPGES